jgi:hypothetical protein
VSNSILIDSTPGEVRIKSKIEEYILTGIRHVFRFSDRKIVSSHIQDPFIFFVFSMLSHHKYHSVYYTVTGVAISCPEVIDLDFRTRKYFLPVFSDLKNLLRLF